MALGEQVHLKQFKSSELIFDNDETFAILRWIFKNNQSAVNAIRTVNYEIRNFAQGLLLEAIDASYKIGFINILYNVFYLKPPTSIRKILIKFGRKAASHWFKHVKAKDMSDLKVYEMVRVVLERNFKTDMYTIAKGGIRRKGAIAMIDYNGFSKIQIAWG